ncbi:MAG: exodeoxyribonuclease VII large subunit [Microbacter sp.]
MEQNSVQTFSLYELNQMVRHQVAAAFPSSIWVRAEISELRENANGHCFLELIEKDKATDRIVAKMKASIWASTYQLLKAYFESVVGESLKSGFTVLAFCNVEFHEVYGISLIINDIDPSFTLGEMAAQRLRFLQQLEAEGMLNMNKQLSLSILPQRIAVISSATAAGYGDFIDQLHHNRYGYRFYVHLFPALMQGEQTEQSIIDALDLIFEKMDQFNVVVILRGGGAVADLSSFDRYALAVHCAQFPLPIITGIGHFRDDTLIDHVAFSGLKTPTAVAEFLIDKVHQAHDMLNDRISMLQQSVNEQFSFKQRAIQHFIGLFPLALAGKTELYKKTLTHRLSLLRFASMQIVTNHQQRLNQQPINMQHFSKQQLIRRSHEVQLREDKLKYINPISILQHGYCVAFSKHKRITSSTEVKAGDALDLGFYDGIVSTKVTR